MTTYGDRAERSPAVDSGRCARFRILNVQFFRFVKRPQVRNARSIDNPRAFRHAFRVSELIDVRIANLDLEAGRVFVRRLKSSTSTNQPIPGDEVRAIRALLRLRGETSSLYLFLGERGTFTRQAVNYLVRQADERAKLEIRVHPHMLRHSTGYYLANRGCDTRLIQDYLGHVVNINHTVRYTKTAAFRFEGLWK